jgi:hypothetical protein
MSLSTPRLSVPAAAVTLAAGIFAGYALVGGPPGIGFPLTALFVVAALITADPSIVRSPDALGFGGLSLVLVSTAALRDAEWIVALNLLAALPLAAFAVARVSTWASLPIAAIRAMVNAILAPARVGVVLMGRIAGPRRAGIGPVLRGLLVGALLLLLFGPLLMSADTAFAQITEDLLAREWFGALLPARLFTAVLVVGIAGGLAVTYVRFKQMPVPDPEALALARDSIRKRIRSRAEWVLPLALLDLLFVAFVAVQIAVLFGGRDHVLDTAGVTYAEYARSGFFQLLAVAFLTLAVISVAIIVTRSDEARDKKLLQVLLGILCVCTLVMLLSAFDRLTLYENTFGFTRLRIGVHATILWVAGVFAMVIGAGITWRAKWFPRAFVAFTAVALIGFTIANPDAIIAEKNVQRYEETGKLDTHYVSTLSADALPALLELPRVVEAEFVGRFVERLSYDEPWASGNVARARARHLLETR